jgi:hypothetical protein
MEKSVKRASSINIILDRDNILELVIKISELGERIVDLENQNRKG